MTILNGNDATLCWQPLPNTRKHFAILEAILRWRSLNCFNFSVITLGVTTCHTEIWYAAFSARKVLKAPSMRFLLIMFRYPIKHFRQRQVDLTHQNGYVSNFQSEWSLMWNHKGVCIRSGRNISTKEWIVKGIKNGCSCIVEIRGTQGCALVGDPARAVGECRDVAKAQP